MTVDQRVGGISYVQEKKEIKRMFCGPFVWGDLVVV